MSSELQSLSDAYQTMERLLSENGELKVRAETAERDRAISESDNQNLHHQNRRLSSERDFYMRRSIALIAKLKGGIAAMYNAINDSESEARGERPAPETQPAQDAGEPVPGFLTHQPERSGEFVVDLKSLAAAIVTQNA